MYQRTQLINTALAPIGQVGAQFLEDVNDFPSVAILRPMTAGKIGEQHQNVSSRRATIIRNSIGGHVTLDALTLTIRGYVRTTEEDSINSSEELARQIETAIQSLRSPLIYSAKVLTVHTDEGLMSPYGICDVQCVIEWMNEL